MAEWFLPIVISVVALLYTYSIDKKESKEILKIKNVKEFYLPEYVQISKEYEGNRLSLRKKYKFNIQNNSNRDVIIDKIRISSIDTVHHGDFIVSGNITGYTFFDVSAENDFISKPLPLIIKSMNYKSFYLDYGFITGIVASSKISERFLQGKNSVSILEEELDNFKNEEGFYLYDKIKNEPENTNRFTIELTTSKGNTFTHSFGYYYNFSAELH